MKLLPWPILGRLARFAVIGAAATVIYAVLAAAFGAAGMEATAASLLAYGLGGLVSYLGHKRVTFRSGRAHAVEAPRFAAACALGAAIAAAAPLVFTDWLRLPGYVAIGITCVAVPALNFVVLNHLVFSYGIPAAGPLSGRRQP